MPPHTEVRRSNTWEVPITSAPNGELLGLIAMAHLTLSQTEHGWLQKVEYDAPSKTVRLETKHPFQFELSESIRLIFTGAEVTPNNLTYLGDARSINGTQILSALMEGNGSLLLSMSPEQQFKVVYSIIAAAAQQTSP